MLDAAQPAPATNVLTYEQLDNVHSLRGFCAFYVLLYHAKYILWSGGKELLQAYPRTGWKLGDYLGFGLAMFTSAGYEMVIFFFVLSGFFIRYATQRKSRPVLRFYLNRMVRIYPPFLASLVLAALVLAVLAMWRPDLLTVAAGRELNAGLAQAWQDMRGQPLISTTRALLFLKAGQQFFGYNNVYWSLLPEGIFYLLVPLAFWRARIYYIVSALLFGVGVFVQMQHTVLPSTVEYFIVYNAYFALGSWLHDLLVARPGLRTALARVNGPLLALLLLVLLGAIIGLAAMHLRVVSVPLAGVLAVLGTLLLLSGRISRQNLLVRTFHNIGLFSFSLYLYHFPLLLLCYALLTHFTGTLFTYDYWFWLFVPAATLGCYALYWVTERPAVQYFRGI